MQLHLLVFDRRAPNTTKQGRSRWQRVNLISVNRKMNKKKNGVRHRLAKKALFSVGLLIYFFLPYCSVKIDFPLKK